MIFSLKCSADGDLSHIIEIAFKLHLQLLKAMGNPLGYVTRISLLFFCFFRLYCRKTQSLIKCFLIVLQLSKCVNRAIYLIKQL